MLEFGAGTLRFFRGQQEAQVVAEDTDAAIANGTFDAGIAGWTDQSTGGASIAHDAGNASLQLNGNGTDLAIAEQQVAIGVDYRSNPHVLRFRVIGASESGQVLLRIGTTSGGNDIADDVACKAGWHSFEFDPDGNASVYVQFRNAENAAHDIDDVALIDDAAVEIGTPYTADDLLELKYVQDADRMWLAHAAYKPMELTRSGHASWSLTYFTPTADPFTAADLYPAAVGLFEQRLVFGYTNTNPQRLFFSQSGALQDMTTGTGRGFFASGYTDRGLRPL